MAFERYDANPPAEVSSIREDIYKLLGSTDFLQNKMQIQTYKHLASEFLLEHSSTLQDPQYSGKKNEIILGLSKHYDLVLGYLESKIRFYEDIIFSEIRNFINLSGCTNLDCIVFDNLSASLKINIDEQKWDELEEYEKTDFESIINAWLVYKFVVEAKVKLNDLTLKQRMMQYSTLEGTSPLNLNEL